MPIIDQIELFLDGSYPNEEQKSFIFKSRCICNYLERALLEKKFETSFSRVNIHCSKDETKTRVHPLKGDQLLEVCIKYDLPPLSTLDAPSLQFRYAQIIDFGLRAAEGFMTVPHGYCMSALRKFEKGGFKNQWTQAEKNWGPGAIRCAVIADLNMEQFALWQHIYRDGDLIASRRVALTKPREMLFIDYLGNLSKDNSGNIVYKRKGKTITKFSLEENKFVVT
jgi:hypothetical protein